ncbi:MAG: hypothetical protein GQF41_3672 [Candidatus Rifleibacterium amylolyticum]|nr:MAG: hypothetical protein GQF41_3672 [Candidatus Rifleibacterium amylolyticum]
MNIAAKIDSKTRLLLTKISGVAAIIGLLILVRELGWRDVGTWPAFTAAFAALLGTAIFVGLFMSTSFNQQPESTTKADNKAASEAYTTNIPDISIFYRLHQNAGDLGSSSEKALLMLVEALPERILALYEVRGKDLAFSCGARMSSRQKCETISPADDLVAELSQRVNSCMDAALLKTPARFSKPLFFSRTQESEDGMLLPVACDNEIFAVLAVLSTTDRSYGAGETDFLKHFCTSLAVCYRNHMELSSFNDASLLEAESRLTQRLFSDMLPEAAKSLPGWDIAQLSAYSASHSGDFHDYIMLPGNRMLIIAGRTSTGGLSSALYLSRLRTMLSCLCENCASPADLLNRLSNQLTCDKSLDLFASLIAVQIKANDRSVTLAVAGHATPLINRPRSGFVEIPQLAAGVPMGLFSQGVDPYQNQVIQLLPGDGILIYTDGALDFAGEKGNRLGSEDLRLLLDKMPEQYADDLLANLADQLVPAESKTGPLEDYTFIYASTE